jgi:hypothetical protein
MKASKRVKTRKAIKSRIIAITPYIPIRAIAFALYGK